MADFMTSWRQVLPSRRRRRWRYVSPGRKGIGLIVFALVVGLIYGYWHLTNPQRVRRQAREVLRKATGGDVSIGHASFSLFQGVELQNVKIYEPGKPDKAPFLDARKIVLRHDPGELFVSGQIVPVEIVLVQPLVTMQYDVEKRTSSIGSFMTGEDQQPAGPRQYEHELPSVQVRDGSLRMVYVDDGLRQGVREMPLNVGMTPAEGTPQYTIVFRGDRNDPGQEGEAAIVGSVVYDLETGQLSRFRGQVPQLESLDQILPAEYSNWRKRYAISGAARWTSLEGAGDMQNVFDLSLEGASVRIPVSEGGFDLKDVRGNVRFTPDGARLIGLTGRIAQAGGARFRLRGESDGYEENSPYELDVQIEDLRIPEEHHGEGRIAGILRFMQAEYKPEGPMDVHATMVRRRDGKVDIQGSLELKGVAITARPFPYRVENAHGKITFDGTKAVIRQVTARNGKSRLTLNGTIDSLSPPVAFDIRMKATDVPLDEKLRKALVPRNRKVWDEFRPRGIASADFTARRTADQEKPKTTLVVHLERQASMEYQRFPYRISELEGDVVFTEREVRARNVRGRSGNARFVADGGFARIDDKPALAVDIEARQLPIDDKLITAFGQNLADRIRAMNLRGMTESALIKLRREPTDSKVSTRVSARLSNASLSPEQVPVELTKASGTVNYVDDKLIIEEITGRYRETPLTISGQITPQPDDVAYDLVFDAPNMELSPGAHDEQLLGKLPSGMVAFLRTLKPQGKANVTLALKATDANGVAEEDFALTLAPQGASLMLPQFPYRFSNLEGTVQVVPGRVTLRKLSARNGQGRLELYGTVRSTEAGWQAALNGNADSWPIEKELLTAIPSQLEWLVAGLQPGGTFSVDLSRMEMLFRPASGEQKSVPPPDINAKGQIAVNQLRADVGYGQKLINGKILGSWSRENGRIAIDAEGKLDKVTINKMVAKEVGFSLTKRADKNVVQLSDLVAKAHGGVVDGFADVVLGEKDVRYGLNVTVAGLDLDKLFNAGVTDPKKKADVSGELTADLKMRATVGEPASRRAAGTLRITKGKVLELPVIFGLLNVIYLQLPSDSALTNGYARYSLSGDKLILSEIYFGGKSLSLLGSGLANLSTEKMDLTFLAGPPGKVPQLKNLAAGMVRVVLGELYEIRIDGTISNPGKPRHVVLRSFDAVIRSLLNPGGKSLQ
ncbi:MAG: hypothetical protein ACLFVU_07615 [Phycisphaerae bacterium]